MVIDVHYFIPFGIHVDQFMLLIDFHLAAVQVVEVVFLMLKQRISLYLDSIWLLWLSLDCVQSLSSCGKMLESTKLSIFWKAVLDALPSSSLMLSWFRFLVDLWQYFGHVCCLAFWGTIINNNGTEFIILVHFSMSSHHLAHCKINMRVSFHIFPLRVVFWHIRPSGLVEMLLLCPVSVHLLLTLVVLSLLLFVLQ